MNIEQCIKVAVLASLDQKSEPYKQENHTELTGTSDSLPFLALAYHHNSPFSMRDSRALKSCKELLLRTSTRSNFFKIDVRPCRQTGRRTDGQTRKDDEWQKSGAKQRPFEGIPFS